MADTVIQTYLDHQFLRTADTEAVGHLNKAVTEVVKRLKAKKARIIPFTLVAIDPSVPDTDPILQEVEKIISGKWPTFKNSVARTKDKPTVYMRAAILEALVKLTRENQVYAGLIWLTCADAFPHFDLGKEGVVLKVILEEIGAEHEGNGRQHWGVGMLPSAQVAGEVEVTLKRVSPAKLRLEELVGHLKAAAIHSGWGDGGENPNVPMHQNHAWGSFFGQRASEGIAEVVNAALTNQSTGLNANTDATEKLLRKFVTDFQGMMSRTSESVVTSTKAANRRGELLWWKQTLYSEKLRQSYRSMSPLVAGLAMASDLMRLVQPIYPASVDYLLIEAMRDVFGGDIEEKQPLSFWVKQIRGLSEVHKQLLQPLRSDTEGRRPLGSALHELSADNAAQVTVISGISETTGLSLAELTVWIFHNIQALRLAYAK